MIELDDCGKELHLTDLSGFRAFDTNICMVIKAPRGTMVLFQSKINNNKGSNNYNPGPLHLELETQAQAIRAFMKEHKE